MKIKQMFILLTGIAATLMAIPTVYAGSHVKIYGDDYHHQQHNYHKYRRHGDSPYSPNHNYLYSNRDRYKNYRHDDRRYNRRNDNYYGERSRRYDNNRCGSNGYRDRGYRNYYDYERPRLNNRTYIYVR